MVYLVHGFGGFSPWLTDFKAGTSWLKGGLEQSCLHHGVWEAEQGKSAREERARDQTEYLRSCLCGSPRNTQKCVLLILYIAPKPTMLTINLSDQNM